MSVGIGDRVRVEREQPPRGTWARYAGRVAIVVAVNRAAGEVGVRGPGLPGTIWLRHDEYRVEKRAETGCTAVSGDADRRVVA